MIINNPHFLHREVSLLNQAHISGQNLFVSAYHGFFTLGDEHVPEPQRFDSIPPFAVKLQVAKKRPLSVLLTQISAKVETILLQFLAIFAL